MGEEEVKQVEGEVEEDKAPEATPQTFTKEEVEALVAIKEEEAAEVARKAEFDRLNPIMSQQGADLKRLKETQPSKRSSIDKIHLADMEAREKETGETNPRITELKGLIADEERREADAKDVAYRESQDIVSGFQKRVVALGLKEDSEDYLDIQDWAVRGNYPRAEARLKKLEKEKPVETKPKEGKVEPKETEEVRFKTRLEQEKLKWMGENGMLSTDNNQPSGAAGSDEEFEKLYGTGKLPATPANYKRAQAILDKRQMGG